MIYAPRDSARAIMRRGAPHGRTPLTVLVGLWLCVFGFCFPIYGYTLPGLFKVTAWRLGVCVMVPFAVLKVQHCRERRAAWLVGLFICFTVVRILSLLTLTDASAGSQQITWFIEGTLFLISCTIFSRAYGDFIKRYLIVVFVLGSLSIAVMVIQMIALSFGQLLALPWSQTQFGFPAELLPWTYPVGGGGRILGAFLEPNMSGSMCAFFVAMFLPFVVQRRPGVVSNRVLLAGMLLLSAVALIGTGSRQSGLAAAGCVLATAFYSAAKRRMGRAVALTCVLIAMGVGVAATADPERLAVLTPFGTVQQTVGVRFSDEGTAGTITAGRWEQIQFILETMDAHTLAVGVGEGLGNHGAHNAYLITLQEVGLVGTLLLVVMSAALVMWPMTVVRSRAPALIVADGQAGLNISAMWVFFLFVNWAQLNQSISYLYLAFTFMMIASYGSMVLQSPRTTRTPRSYSSARVEM